MGSWGHFGSLFFSLEWNHEGICMNMGRKKGDRTWFFKGGVNVGLGLPLQTKNHFDVCDYGRCWFYVLCCMGVWMDVEVEVSRHDQMMRKVP